MIRLRRWMVPLALALAPAGALAATYRADGGSLVVNEIRAFTLKGTVAGIGPAQRAALAAKRLAALDEPIALTLKATKDAHLIVANGSTILQVDAADAKSYGVARPALAVRWRTAIESALALPPIKVAKTSFIIGVGRKETMEVVGSDALTATLATSDPSVVAVERTAAGVVLRGVGAGTATVSLLGANGEGAVEVKVQPAAAAFPQALTAEVVGTPASTEMVAAAVRGAVQTRFASLPGARLTIDKVQASSVGAGETTTVKVRVKAEAPDAFPAEGEVAVRVANLGLAKTRETELWYCNEPERVQKPQGLFEATLHAERPVRMLYHYINDSTASLFLRADIVNPSSLPARVAIIPGDAKPHRNPVLAGLDAGDAFLREWLAGSGEVVTIAPGTSLPLALRRLGRLDTASGLCYLRLLPGGPASLRVAVGATPPFDLDERWTAAERNPTPWREVGPVASIPPLQGSEADLVFSDPFRQESVTYRVGGNFGFVRVGQKPIARKTAGKGLDGNFGVVYRIAARAENPSSAPANVEVVFEASAGYSGGLFVVDGEYRRVSPIQPKAEVQLLRFRLEPGQSRDVTLLTVPLSGSSYPATITVRPVSTIAPVGG